MIKKNENKNTYEVDKKTLLTIYKITANILPSIMKNAYGFNEEDFKNIGKFHDTIAQGEQK